MPIYKQTTEITNIDDIWTGVDRDIVEIYFGDKNVFTVWGEYEGTLPATINANGDNMKQYQVWGNTGGVGELTGNLLDESTLVKGFYDRINDEIIINPIAKGSIVFRSFRQSLTPGTYTVSFEHNVNIVRAIVDDVISSNVAENISSYTVTTQTGDIGFSMRRSESSSTPWNNNPTMLTEGSTPPETFVPYGYEVDMGVKSGNLFDKTIAVNYKYLITDGSLVDGASWGITNYINVAPNTAYIIKNAVGENPCYCIYDKDKNLIFGEKYDNRQDVTFVTGSNAAYIRMSLVYNSGDHRYNLDKLRLFQNSIIPIYIGSDPLGKDEYVDYGEQKVYRRTDNLYDGTYMEKGIFSQTGAVNTNDDYRISQYMELGGNHLVVKLRTTENRHRSTYPVVWYDKNKTRLKVALLEWLIDAKDYTFEYPPVTGAKYVRIDYRYNDTDIEVFETWEEDPPVPLPALPTCEGTTIVDYAGESVAQPEKVLLKYRKEGF